MTIQLSQRSTCSFTLTGDPAELVSWLEAKGYKRTGRKNLHQEAYRLIGESQYRDLRSFVIIYHTNTVQVVGAERGVRDSCITLGSLCATGATMKSMQARLKELEALERRQEQIAHPLYIILTGDEWDAIERGDPDARVLPPGIKVYIDISPDEWGI